MFEKITDSQLETMGMGAVANTPTRNVAFGESGLSSADFKKRFDRLPKYLATRLNEIFAGMSDGSLAGAIKISYNEKEYTIKQFMELLLSGAVDDVMIKTIYEDISLATLGAYVVEMYNGIKTGDLATKIIVGEGQTLGKFVEETRALSTSEKEKIVNLVLDALPKAEEEEF